ncbi:MAG: septum formation initiator family protein [Caldilineaceae bacterium]|nr:septum formation initiator family protein [Caldilineaceae bacterium]
MASSSQRAKRGTVNSQTRKNGELTSNRSVLLFLGLIVAAFFIFSYLDRMSELAAVRAELVSLQDEVAGARQRNAELEATLQEVAGSAYVGETARAELGLIQPGDDPFVILNQNPTGEDDLSATASAVPPAVAEARGVDILSKEWWRSLFAR